MPAPNPLGLTVTAWCMQPALEQTDKLVSYYNTLSEHHTGHIFLKNRIRKIFSVVSEIVV
jgi:hypothetical protein